MKIALSILFLFSVLIASGGDTLTFSNEVNTLADGDTFYADKHWGSLRDTLSNVINGRLGNINLAADANIDASKFDITKTAKFDSLASTKGISATIGNFSGKVLSDSGYAAKSWMSPRLRADSATVPILTGNVTTRGNATVAGNAVVDSLASTKGISATIGAFSRKVVSDTFSTTSAVLITPLSSGSVACTLLTYSNALFSGTKDTVGTLVWSKFGKMACFVITGITVTINGTGNSGGFKIKNFPTSIIPSYSQNVLSSEFTDEASAAFFKFNTISGSTVYLHSPVVLNYRDITSLSCFFTTDK